jgi:hypothetical protein
VSNKSVLKKLDSALTDLAAAAKAVRAVAESARPKKPARKRRARAPQAKAPGRTLVVPASLDEEEPAAATPTPAAEPADPLAQFRMTPREVDPSGGGKNFGRKVSLKRGVKENLFVPDPKAELAAAKADRKAWKGRDPTPRGDRGEVSVEKVKARCGRCRRAYMADPYEVNRRGGDGEPMENVCPRCIRNVVPG